MKNTKKWTALLLTALFALGGASGCGKEDVKSNAPDYSKSKKEYTIWAYSGTCDDWYQKGWNGSNERKEMWKFNNE